MRAHRREQLTKPVGSYFSGLAGICFPFSLQIGRTFREVFRLRVFVGFFVLILKNTCSTVVCSP